MIQYPVIVLVGPTAIGKTDLSLKLAEKFNCEIVSLDSMQVYRHMDIGTAKVSPEEQLRVTHHLIDIVDPDEEYNAKRYAEDALKVIQEIHQLHKVPLITGGTGLYLRSLTEGFFDNIGDFPAIRSDLRMKLEKEGSVSLHSALSKVDHVAASSIHCNDCQRILRGLEIYLGTGITWSEHIARQKRQKIFQNILQLGITDERDSLYRRINERTRSMVKNGLEEEVRGLLQKGYSRDLKSMQSIGYKHMVSHIQDGWSLEKTIELLARDTRRYAKRQYTWFNRTEVEWIHFTSRQKIDTKINQFLERSFN